MRVSDYIERGCVVVCANVRLARHFRHRYSQAQLRRGQRAWETPTILSWPAWLRHCRDSRRECNDPAGLLLTSEQESILWRQIIDASQYRDQLLQIPAVADQAAGAWQLLKQYNVPIFPEGMFMNEDATAFKSWADEYRSRCQQNNWIDNASLADILRLDAAADPDAFGGELALVGFDRLTPQQTMLCRALEAAGVSVHEYRKEGRNGSAKVADFADVNEEIQAAAVWARRHLEANGETTIGILTPDLRKLRNRIRYIFEDVLAPGNLHYQGEAVSPPFSISVGQPLADYPLIHVIFSILGLDKVALALETLGVLLRTPFIKGHDRERAGRALLDEKLRSHNRTAFSLADVLYHARTDQDGAQGVPVMQSILHEARSAINELPSRQSPGNWTVSFTGLLEIFGWPGERKLNSAEYQQVESWHSVLDSFAGLQLVAPVMSRGEALFHLHRIATGVSFQPETPETSIQILDPLGAPAMEFDHIWMAGLSEESWPPRHAPNPFIPVTLQKKHGIPGADADDALRRAEDLQAALIRSTPDIVLSHARNDADTDRQFLLSPLLHGLSPLDDAVMQQLQATPWSQIIFDDRRTESFVDVDAPPVTGQYAKGGASLFRDQSQCPFRAFARHRLSSRAPESADVGLNAMQRGDWLHQLMENAWAKLENRVKLVTLSEEELDNLIESVTSELMEQARKRYPLTFTDRFSAIEGKRWAQILRDWLALERRRAPFSVVSREQWVRLSIAGMEITARLDRVDALADGRHIIIDYKSGNVSVDDWKGERPDQPQMPLYALTHPETVAAVAYAGLKRGKNFGFEGLTEDADILPGIKAFEQDSRARNFMSYRETPLRLKQGTDNTGANWDRLFDNWRAVLHELADEFQRGVATVTPQKKACDWCDQQPFCRIHEALQTTNAPLEEK